MLINCIHSHTTIKYCLIYIAEFSSSLSIANNKKIIICTKELPYVFLLLSCIQCSTFVISSLHYDIRSPYIKIIYSLAKDSPHADKFTVIWEEGKETSHKTNNNISLDSLELTEKLLDMLFVPVLYTPVLKFSSAYIISHFSEGAMQRFSYRTISILKFALIC